MENGYAPQQDRSPSLRQVSLQANHAMGEHAKLSRQPPIRNAKINKQARIYERQPPASFQ